MPRPSPSVEGGTVPKGVQAGRGAGRAGAGAAASRTGDAVSAGDELVEIETDKANMTYEAETEGVLAIVAGEGDTLPVGALMARIGEGSSNGAAPEVAELEPEPESAPVALPDPEPEPE